MSFVSLLPAWHTVAISSAVGFGVSKHLHWKISNSQEEIFAEDRARRLTGIFFIATAVSMLYGAGNWTAMHRISVKIGGTDLLSRLKFWQ